MRNKIKKFYEDHEEKVIVALVTFAVTAVVVRSHVERDNRIEYVQTAQSDDRFYIMFEKKNGKKDNFYIEKERVIS